MPLQVAPQLSFETTRSDPSPRVEERDEEEECSEDDDDDVRRGDLHHDEQVRIAFFWLCTLDHL